MQAFPHQYAVWTSADPKGTVPVGAEGLPTLETGPPEEFDGPGGLWSPETLLVAAVVNCFALNFRAIARASGLQWVSLQCRGVGILDRQEGVMRFTEIEIKADLEIASDVNAEHARNVMELSEKTCLISRSLDSEVKLDATVTHVE